MNIPFSKSPLLSILISLSLFNFLFLITFFVYWSNTLYRQLEIFEQNLNLVKSELIFLKTENSALSEEIVSLKLSQIKPLPIADIIPIVSDTGNQSHVLLGDIIFIVAAILLFSFLIYFFGTGLSAWFYKNFILKIISITDALTLKLLAILGCGPVHHVEFSDTAGNNYIVNLALQDSTVEVLIQAVNTSHYVSVPLYVQNLNLNMMSLTSQVNTLLTSPFLSMYPVANNTEVINLITEVSQLL